MTMMHHARAGANFVTQSRSNNMHAASILDPEMIALTPGDTLDKALRAMDELKMSHLPVVADGHYLGLAEEDDFLDNDGDHVFVTNARLMPVAVGPDQHFLEVVDAMLRDHLAIMPVVDSEGYYLGSATQATIFKALSSSFSGDDSGSILTLRMGWPDYSLAQIAHRVESNEAKIIQVFITDKGSDNVEVALRLNTRDVEAVVESLRRHGYDVSAFFKAEEYAEDIKERFDAFMRYLKP
jgi:acetoin utilization protein AcuB